MKNILEKLGMGWKRILSGAAVLLIFLVPLTRNVLSKSASPPNSDKIKGAKEKPKPKTTLENNYSQNSSVSVKSLSSPSSGSNASPKSNTHSSSGSSGSSSNSLAVVSNKPLTK